MKYKQYMVEFNDEKFVAATFLSSDTLRRALLDYKKGSKIKIKKTTYKTFIKHYNTGLLKKKWNKFIVGYVYHYKCQKK